MTHDARTPAGGDSIKLIDPPAFDEEAHYHELLSGSEWDGFSAEYGIDGVKLDQAVRGEGTLGALLDIADKLAYVGRDALAFLGGDGRISPACHGAGYYTIADIVGHDPLVCGLWESVRLVGGRAVINDADRLERFLALRAFLFRELYYNPASRFFEYLLGRGVAKYLYQNGVISREELLSEGDEWIERKVEEFLGGHYVLRGIHFLGHTRLEEHSSQASAHRRAAEFDGDDSVFTIVDEFQHVANSAARKLFVRRKGEVVPFSEARPEAAENIDSLMTFRSVPRVYFFSADDLHISPETRARMKTVFRYLREHQ